MGDAMTVHIGQKDYKCVILEKTQSTSSRYEIFLGTHYHGCQCWIVGAYNRDTGELIQRHYNEKMPGNVNDTHAKSRAYEDWAKFKEAMTAITETEETENAAQVERWLN